MEKKQTRYTRSGWEVDMDILDAIGLSKETHKTRAMASAYLDIRNFERHLDTLIAGGFVHLRVDGRYKYLSVTPEGELLRRRLRGVSVLYAPEEVTYNV